MIFNPLDKFYKSKRGAVSENEKIIFRVKAKTFCTLVVNKDGGEKDFYPMQKEGDFFKIEISFSRGLYFYYFINERGNVSCNHNYLGDYCENIKPFQLTIYKKNYAVPKWLAGGIIYQIFPDRFYREEKKKPQIKDRILREDWGATPEFMPNEKGKVLNNDFFGGDIKGIIKKLPYIKKLNVSAIYLNPIFRASSNHRYDTGNYMEIDPYLGTQKDFEKLIKKADELGVKIILDGVFNHTGDDSIYFNKYGNYDSLGAYQCQKSKYKDWYNFIEYPNKYDSWWGIDILPSLNKNNKDYVNFITGKNGVIEKYSKMGIGGWRLDVVDELPDAMVKKIRKALKAVNKSGILIGEVWEDATDKIAYGTRRKYFQGEELDSVMNYPLKNAIIDFVLNKNAKNLSYVVKEQSDRYPKQALNALMNVLATHDTFRLLSAVGENVGEKTKQELKDFYLTGEELSVAKTRLKMAVLLSYMLPGVPSIYYGDEIGMQGYKDPLNRRCFDWKNIDKDILNWYIKLGEIRLKYKAFEKGDFEEIYSNKGVFVFKRVAKNSEILVAINLSSDSICLEYDGILEDLISGEKSKDGAVISTNKCAIMVAK